MTKKTLIILAGLVLVLAAPFASCSQFVCGNYHGTPVCWCDL